LQDLPSVKFALAVLMMTSIVPYSDSGFGLSLYSLICLSFWVP
jgi:hypothetical protein